MGQMAFILLATAVQADSFPPPSRSVPSRRNPRRVFAELPEQPIGSFTLTFKENSARQTFVRFVWMFCRVRMPNSECRRSRKLQSSASWWCWPGSVGFTQKTPGSACQPEWQMDRRPPTLGLQG